MFTIGREIENAINSLMSISEEFANLQAKYEYAQQDLNMLETLFSVTRYIGSDTEPQAVLTVLEDSIKGVFGARYCHVIFEPQKTHLGNSKELYPYLDYEQLSYHVHEAIMLQDLSNTDLTTLTEGSMLIVPLKVGEELYGFLACYWSFAKDLTPASKVFLQIISTQVSMYLKSAHLIGEFKALAVLDPLTGIYNRSYLSNIEATTQPVFGESILMFDIDRFKRINDTHGHQYGDQVLRQFAGILTEWALRGSGVAFKYGGEEFVIKCEGGEKSALEIAKGVRQQFFNETGYTVSVGIATIGVSCMVTHYDYLIRQADDALYVSKQCGRDRITLSSPDIQVLKQSGKALSQLVSKSFRQMTPTALFRFKLIRPSLLSEEQYQQASKSISAMARLYDQVFITPSLDCLMIIDGVLDLDDFIIRSFRYLRQHVPFLSYDIISLETVFKEVVVHSSRVSELSQIIAGEMGFSASEINELRLACEWHDVGKLCTNPLVYMKRGQLSEEEYQVIKLHSWLSYSIADSHPILTKFSDWVLFHHEDYNGKGYFGLLGDDIPFAAQIISLVDKFDALTEDRCYRPAYTWQQALDILRNERYKFNDKLFIHFEALVLRMMQDSNRVQALSIC